MRPLPSIKADWIPRAASWAARIVPEAPPPTMATGTFRSDFVVRPALRVCCPRFPLDHMIMHPVDRLAGRLREPARHKRMDEAGGPCAHQGRADDHGAHPMSRPTHSQRARMIDEQAVQKTRIDFGPRLRRRHIQFLFQIWRPRQDSNLWPSD